MVASLGSSLLQELLQRAINDVAVVLNQPPIVGTDGRLAALLRMSTQLGNPTAAADARLQADVNIVLADRSTQADPALATAVRRHAVAFLFHCCRCSCGFQIAFSHPCVRALSIAHQAASLATFDSLRVSCRCAAQHEAACEKSVAEVAVARRAITDAQLARPLEHTRVMEAAAVLMVELDGLQREHVRHTTAAEAAWRVVLGREAAAGVQTRAGSATPALVRAFSGPLTLPSTLGGACDGRMFVSSKSKNTNGASGGDAARGSVVALANFRDRVKAIEAGMQKLHGMLARQASADLVFQPAREFFGAGGTLIEE
eukprot:SAG11_NODE_3200_length_2615_cov_3.093800_2_plen_315_part_00